MRGPDDDMGPLDDVLWVRGVPYLDGWRDAADAVRELSDALEAAGVSEGDLRLRADAAPDGTGVVRLTCSAAVARDLALLARLRSAG